MIRLDEHAYGLDDERLVRIHRLLNDYDPNLSLRAIPPGDPIAPWAAQQGHDYGVYESGVAHSAEHHGGNMTNWVFTLAKHEVDDRVIARVLEADFRRNGVEERIARHKAHEEATKLSQLRALMDKQEARRDEMLALGEMSRHKATIRHKIHGEDVIIGDTVRPLRTHIG